MNRRRRVEAARACSANLQGNFGHEQDNFVVRFAFAPIVVGLAACALACAPTGKGGHPPPSEKAPSQSARQASAATVVDAAPSSSAATVADASPPGAPDAGAVTAAEPASRRACPASPAGVVVASSPHTPYRPSIAVGPGGVLVTWLEDSPPTRPDCPTGCKPTNAFARLFDPATLSPDSRPVPPVRVSEGLNIQGFTGFAPVALTSGFYATACTAHVVTGSFDCHLTPIASPALPDSTWNIQTPSSALVVGFGAATGADGTALHVVPVRGEMCLLASGTHGRGELIAEVGEQGTNGILYDDAAWIDAPAIIHAGTGEAVVVWRATPPPNTGDTSFTPPAIGDVPGSIRARLVGTDGHARGHVVSLSAPGDHVGAPAVAWIAGSAMVLFSHRRTPHDAWRLALARWTPGSPPVQTEVETDAQAVAAAIAPEPGASGCAIAGWTEGQGHSTVGRTGRLCPGSAKPSSVVQFSRPGIEAGASVLATDGARVFALWTEFPGHRAPAELRLARVDCAEPVPARPAVSCSAGMAALPGGKYTMGERYDTVRVQAFCMDVTEVTVAAYTECVTANACTAPNPYRGDMATERACNWQRPGTETHPVNCVDWGQATSYCGWAGKRLPTEEEWEWGARGASEGRRYPWGNDSPAADRVNACGTECVLWSKTYGGEDKQAMYQADDGWPTTSPVGSFPRGATPQGLQDMAGNVWELTASSYGADSRVYRGGSWACGPLSCVLAKYREGIAPSRRASNLGFRCAR
jgi:formylglycine-generating enzyme required for sulfatase activity